MKVHYFQFFVSEFKFKWDYPARKAKQEPTHRFRDLSRCLNETHLRHAFSKMNKKAASGVDNVTYRYYQNHFDENVDDLIVRLKRQSYKARLVKRKHIPRQNTAFGIACT